jgi:hypothetical protein
MPARYVFMYFSIPNIINPPTICKMWQWSFSPFKISGRSVHSSTWLVTSWDVGLLFPAEASSTPPWRASEHTPISSSRGNGKFPPPKSDTNIKLITRLHPAPNLRVREASAAPPPPPTPASVSLRGMVVGGRDSSQFENVKRNELTPRSRVLPRI